MNAHILKLKGLLLFFKKICFIELHYFRNNYFQLTEFFSAFSTFVNYLSLVKINKES